MDTMEEPSTLDTMETIARSPEVESALENLGAAFVRGAAQGIEDGPITAEERDQAVTEIGVALTDGVAEGIGDALPPPERLVNRGLSAATSDANRAATQLLVAEVTETLVRSATSSLAEGMREDIFPAIDEASEKASPAIATMLNEDTREVVGSMAFEISKQSTLGVEAGMDAVASQDEALNEGLLGHVSVVGWIVIGGLIGLSAIAVIAAVAAGLRSRRQSILLENSRGREQVLAALASGSLGDSQSSIARLRELGFDVGPADVEGGASDPTVSSSPTRPRGTKISALQPTPAFSAT